MKKEIVDLIDISRFYGAKKDYTLGGGGNTSYKDENYIYIKASGYALATITEEGFAVLDRNALSKIMNKNYSSDIQIREEEVMRDLMNSHIKSKKKLRPSVEASLHDIIQYPYVVHTHPFLVNALLCAKDVKRHIQELFGQEVLFVPYVDPGYILSKKINSYLDQYRSRYGFDPKILFLQNHGVFVGGESVAEIKRIYDFINTKILSRIQIIIEIDSIDYKGPVNEIITLLSIMLGEKMYYKHRFNTLIAHYTKDQKSITRVDRPFIPDEIVYCKAHPMKIPIKKDLSIHPSAIEKSLYTYQKKFGYDPKVILVEKGPVIAVEKNEAAAKLVLDVFEDAMKISFYSNFFGGPNFLNDKQIHFIENWEAENYRRKVSAGS